MALGIGARRWRATTDGMRARLETQRISSEFPRYDARQLEGQPAPVQRYFRAVLKDGQPIIAGATVELTGTFNLSASGEQWKPFTSRQWFVTRRAGFLWDAQIAMLPGVAVRVFDACIGGEGMLRAMVLGLFTVADVRGSGEIARGELMRFLAEMAWCPTALLPSQGVRWEAVDDHSANATIVDGPHTLTLLFTFNDAGLIDSAQAEARGAMVDKELVLLPWEGRWFDYRVHDGMVLPFGGEAAWLRPEGRRPYFRGAVTLLSHQFSQ